MSVVFKDVLGCFFPSEGTAGMQFNEEPREEQTGERKFEKVKWRSFGGLYVRIIIEAAEKS